MREVARAAGVHENSVYAWVAGKTTPQAAKAHRLAAALGVPSERLFPAVHPAPTRPQPQTNSTQRRTGDSAGRPRRRQPPAGGRAFVRHLAHVMAQRHLTVSKVATDAGVSRETIGRWLSGATSPQREAAANVAAALDMPWDRLYPAPPTPLAAALAERGWSASRLATAIRVGRDTAADWAAGRHTPSADHAHRIAAALDRSVTHLFDLRPDGDAPLQASADAPVLTPVEVLARPATGQHRWRDQAACAAPDQDPERWWPPANEPAVHARQVCAGCPVLGDCRDAYLTQPDRPDDRDGIWAGLRGYQLRAAQRQQLRERLRDRSRHESPDREAAKPAAIRAPRRDPTGPPDPARAPHAEGGERESLVRPPRAIAL